MSKWLLKGLMLLMLAGCQRESWVLRTDPILEPYMRELLAEWQRQDPNNPTPEIFIQSTEFIVQGEKFGRPADLLFVVNAHFPELADTAQAYSRREVLGGDYIAWTAINSPMLQHADDSCLALPPTGNPIRRMIEEWKPGLGFNSKGCTAFPQSAPLLMDYASKGKVNWAILLGKDAWGLREEVKELSRGPEWPDLYQALIPKNAAHSAQAAKFLDFVATEKNKISVGDFPTNM